MKKTLRLTAAALLCALPLVAAQAGDKGAGSGSMTKGADGDKMKMDHSMMKAPKGNGEAAATGVINAVDAGKNTINVTHDPVAALGWPKMTMDLPVTRRVDLDGVKKGQKVQFMLKKGRDNVFRVTEIKPAK